MLRLSYHVCPCCDHVYSAFQNMHVTKSQNGDGKSGVHMVCEHKDPEMAGFQKLQLLKHGFSQIIFGHRNL